VLRAGQVNLPRSPVFLIKDKINEMNYKLQTRIGKRGRFTEQKFSGSISEIRDYLATIAVNHWKILDENDVLVESGSKNNILAPENKSEPEPQIESESTEKDLDTVTTPKISDVFVLLKKITNLLKQIDLASLKDSDKLALHTYFRFDLFFVVEQILENSPFSVLDALRDFVLKDKPELSLNQREEDV